jgi:aspartate kinase
MALVVTKFGGSSVATPEHIMKVAQRLIDRKNAGDDVVAVVSAMGDATDELYALAEAVGTATPRTREMDMLLSTGEQVTIALLAMAIHSLGGRAISFTGPQVGIVTDRVHGKARIVAVDAACVKEELAADNIVIIAGFQGTTPTGEITTLGRGGSDTTAVAVAAGIGADVCEINSDVDGIYTADPRIVADARKIDRISSEEMLEMAASGAGVLSMRSVEFARNHDVAIHSRGTFADGPGTIVTGEETGMEQAIVSAVTHDTDDAKFTIRGVEDRPGVAAILFNALAKQNVNVDMVIQNVSEEGLTDISFTAPHADVARATMAVTSVIEQLGARTWLVDEDVAKVSIIGAGMRTHPGVTAKMFQTLADEGINIDLISTSPIRLSCIIALDDTERAVQVLHQAFELDKE